MSASLVGSEMCIRDSFLHRRAAGQGGPAPAAAALWARSHGASLPEARACLLYTSDAADDM
eukprot:3496995-Alexandrium_andersonii.AAC.1